MTTISAALGQMLVVPGELSANVARACDMIGEAGRAGCDIIVLPECLDIGWTDLRAAELATAIPGPVTDRLTRQCRDHAIYAAAGITERDGDTVRNSAILIDRSGEILAHHRKINELPFAQRVYRPGQSLRVVDTEFGVVALNICADNYVSSLALADAQAAMGAQIIVSPSSWAVPPDFDDAATPYVEWQEPYRLIGERHGIPVIGVSNVGPVTTGEWAGWQCIGRSLATYADGSVASWGSYGPDAVELNTVTIEF